MAPYFFDTIGNFMGQEKLFSKQRDKEDGLPLFFL